MRHRGQSPGVAEIKDLDKNLTPMISRAYKRHKLWSKLTLKNGSSAMPAYPLTGKPSTPSLPSFAPPDAAAGTSTARRLPSRTTTATNFTACSATWPRRRGDGDADRPPRITVLRGLIWKNGLRFECPGGAAPYSLRTRITASRPAWVGRWLALPSARRTSRRASSFVLVGSDLLAAQLESICPPRARR